MKHPTWIIAALYLLSSISAVGSADDSVDAQRRFLLTGMRAERDKLRSGQVIITGEHWGKTTRTLGMMRLPVRFDVYFDHDLRSYRYTQQDYEAQDAKFVDPRLKATLLARKDLPRGTTPDGVEWLAHDMGGTIVRTPDYDLHNSIGHPHVDRSAPGTANGYAVREWDFAKLGLVDWHSFGGKLHLPEILEAFETFWICHSVEMAPTGLSCLKLRTVFNPFADSVELEIWIDEKQGMTPISVARHDLRNSLKETSRSDVSWREINGAMVPVSLRISNIHRLDYTEGYDLTLEWSHVNEKLDPKVFTPAGITDSPGAMVADMRLGQIVVERVNQMPLPDFATHVTSQPIHPAAPSRWRWLILANVIGGGVAWWFYHRRDQQKHG